MSYVKLYEDNFKAMFQASVDNSSNKISTRNMREIFLYIYSDKFSIPGETETKQFIGKPSQKDERDKSKLTTASNNGRKTEKTPLWYVILKKINKDPKEKIDKILDTLKNLYIYF